MTSRLNDRVAIVTGAADGMGAATTALFAAEGAHVLAVDVNGGRLTAEHAGRDGVTKLVQDISAPEAADAIVQAALGLGGIDILVNNAGIRGERGAIDQTTDENWRRVMDINLDGAFRLSRQAAPSLKASGHGRIINVGSIQGMLAAPTLGAYVTSKHALNGLTRALALDLGPAGVTVNCIMPGFVITGLTRNVEQDAPEVWKRMMVKIVVGRAGTAEDIAAMALFLASDEASFITGACIPVDGGMSCWS